jgi:hypothetical protein
MKLDMILTKVFKFVAFVLFTFMTLVYFGVLLILPLDVLFQIVRIFHAIGLPTAFAAAAGIAAFGYLGYVVARMPALYGLILDIGKQLVVFGQTQLARFDEVGEEAGVSHG